MSMLSSLSSGAFSSIYNTAPSTPIHYPAPPTPAYPIELLSHENGDGKPLKLIIKPSSLLGSSIIEQDKDIKLALNRASSEHELNKKRREELIVLSTAVQHNDSWTAISPDYALALAAAARKMVEAEVQTNEICIQECLQRLENLRDAADLAYTKLQEADHQMGRLLTLLNFENISIRSSKHKTRPSMSTFQEPRIPSAHPALERPAFPPLPDPGIGQPKCRCKLPLDQPVITATLKVSIRTTKLRHIVQNQAMMPVNLGRGLKILQLLTLQQAMMTNFGDHFTEQAGTGVSPLSVPGQGIPQFRSFQMTPNWGQDFGCSSAQSIAQLAQNSRDSISGPPQQNVPAQFQRSNLLPKPLHYNQQLPQPSDLTSTASEAVDWWQWPSPFLFQNYTMQASQHSPMPLLPEAQTEHHVYSQVTRYSQFDECHWRSITITQLSYIIDLDSSAICYQYFCCSGRDSTLDAVEKSFSYGHGFFFDYAQSPHIADINQLKQMAISQSLTNASADLMGRMGASLTSDRLRLIQFVWKAVKKYYCLQDPNGSQEVVNQNILKIAQFCYRVDFLRRPLPISDSTSNADSPQALVLRWHDNAVQAIIKQYFFSSSSRRHCLGFLHPSKFDKYSMQDLTALIFTIIDMVMEEWQSGSFQQITWSVVEIERRYNTISLSLDSDNKNPDIKEAMDKLYSSWFDSAKKLLGTHVPDTT
ncbi:hypothetical protein CPB84DRAFT_1750902 [Gymnopilus junonius]|uniref:DUF6532 domain-containing protein n=1 Tax=Gymnopilus junonius TaxID=109634 RepID=A0A9P5NGQ5_GYMJU|nr:hypothetical protein CPB84DRAFT_1750902 [Gymnopilus junonius]